MKGQWTKRRATVQLAMAGLRLTTLSSASGANPTGLEASAEQTAVVEQVEALPPQGKLAVITHAARKLTRHLQVVEKPSQLHCAGAERLRASAGKLRPALRARGQRRSG